MANLTNSGKLINKIESLEPIEYHAGEGISIGNVSMNARKGPSPDGFHVPSKDEWGALCGILTSTFGMASDATTMVPYLKMPMAGSRRYSSSSVYGQGAYGYYWSSTASSADYAYYLSFRSSSLTPQNGSNRAGGFSVRCFKDSPVIPTASWTTLYDGSSIATGAGVFYNATYGLISVSGDGTTWYTIQDKNLGASTVYNQGDTLSEANCGKYYQRGNNYGFPWTGSVTTSSTQVDASNYGPNTANGYYESATFITGSGDWSSVHNDDLWGDTTGTITQENVISNTGVLSVNGQTGDVTISVPTKVSDLTNDSNFQTDTQVSQSIATAVASAYKYKGSVANQAALPASGNTAGDVYNTEDTGMNYAWTGTAWDQLGSTVDLSNYLAKNNTTAFTPTGDYNPATKKYVDDVAASINSAEWGNITGTLSDQTDLQAALNAKVGSSNNTINNVVHLSQADYDALQNPDSNTWYSTPDNGSGGFDPENAGSVGQVVTKTATGYAYADAPVKSVNGQTGDVTINTPEGEGIRIFKLTTDTPDSTTMAAIAEAIRGSVKGTSEGSDLVNRYVYPVYIERATDNYDSEELAYNRNRKIYRLTSYSCSAGSGFETANFVCDTGGTIVYYLTIQGTNIASSCTYTYSSQWQVISGDSKKYTIKTSSSAPASGTSNSIITFVTQ